MEKREEYNQSFKDKESLFVLISCVDPSKDLRSNVKILNKKVNKPDLQDAVAHLKDNFSAKYPIQMNLFQKVVNITKEVLLGQLVTFVEQTLPVLCLKCEVTYTPMHQEDSAADDVSCIKCKIPAHRQCYKKDDLNINLGIVFLCQSCLVNMGKTDEKQEIVAGDLTEDESENEDDGWIKKVKKYRKKKSNSKPSSDDSSSSSTEERPKSPKNKEANERRSSGVKKKKTLLI